MKKIPTIRPASHASRPSKKTGREASKQRPEENSGRGRGARSEESGHRSRTPRADESGHRPRTPRADEGGIKSRSSRSDGEAVKTRPEREGQKARRSHQSGREGLFINNWSALGEYLRSQPGALQKIFHAPRETKRMQQLLEQHGVTLPCEEDQELETGFAAQVALHYKDEEQLLREAAARTEDLIIACDHVTDTRNLGAIARTAAFFGLSTILMPKDRQAPITSATLGTAQGAFATVTPTEVTNLGRTLLALKDCGYWIASADMVGTPVDKLPTRYEKLVLVLGSEDKGVSTQILNKSDFTLSIPSFGGKLESLNVSVAAGILIHALRAVSAAGKILPQG